MDLSQKITQLKGVGPQTLEKLASLGMHTQQDLLFHLPTRYQDKTHLTPLNALRPQSFALVQGTIVANNVRFARRRYLECVLKDRSGAALSLRFFHFSRAQQDNLAIGTLLRCFGEIHYARNMLCMHHPECERITTTEAPLQETLTPVYPSTQGLQQRTLRRLIEQVLNHSELATTLHEIIPEDILKLHNLPTLYEALHLLHSPPIEISVAQLERGEHPAQQRLALEELAAHHITSLSWRSKQKQRASLPIKTEQKNIDNFCQTLPFALTQAQQTVLKDITEDLAQSVPMLRLLQGDVGSGKTVVAAIAMWQAVSKGYQAALMAPTELLAEQHAANFRKWFNDFSVNVTTLTGHLPEKLKAEHVDAIETGAANMIIGTHALIQKNIQFKKLALIIIDEQHRFGVHQRWALFEKGQYAEHAPHQLIMTATPIPRTLAMTLYADLDYSAIDMMPPGRKPIQTLLINAERREEIMTRIMSLSEKKQQVYWVCTLIADSETLDCQNAEETAQALQEALPQLRVGLLHGKLKQEEKNHVMALFKQGKFDILVATTVVEVGVDVPNASLMVIENPERLGLAQLHQLRGRVGRGGHEGYCILLYQSPLSEHAMSRLQAVRNTNDGFKLAEYDLEQRGSGEWFGTQQSGFMPFKIADFVRDRKLVPTAHNIAKKLLAEDPAAAAKLVARWLGRKVQYGEV